MRIILWFCIKILELCIQRKSNDGKDLRVFRVHCSRLCCRPW